MCTIINNLAEVQKGAWSPTSLLLLAATETIHLDVRVPVNTVQNLRTTMRKGQLSLPQETCYLTLTGKPISSYSLISCNLLSHKGTLKASPE